MIYEPSCHNENEVKKWREIKKKTSNFMIQQDKK
jgi:hypothetical protein